MDWTHSNSVHYDPASKSVIMSIRNLSRLIKVDYDTKDIIELELDKEHLVFASKDDNVDDNVEIGKVA